MISFCHKENPHQLSLMGASRSPLKKLVSDYGYTVCPMIVNCPVCGQVGRFPFGLPLHGELVAARKDTGSLAIAAEILIRMRLLPYLFVAPLPTSFFRCAAKPVQPADCSLLAINVVVKSSMCLPVLSRCSRDTRRDTPATMYVAGYFRGTVGRNSL